MQMSHPLRDEVRPLENHTVKGSALSPCLRAALEYAKRGWSVLPLHSVHGDGTCTCEKKDCRNPGKHPRTCHGVKDATSDSEKIVRWWNAYPNANVGIATGARSNIVGLDVDPRHGGESSLGDIEKTHGKLPKTLESETGGGGRHILFLHPGGAVINRVGIADGLDIRGDGGYLVAPPSVHASGHAYTWHSPTDTPLASIPSWLLEIVRRKPSQSKEDEADAKIIKEGERNATLTRYAGSMRRVGMETDDLFAALAIINNKKCYPPLEETEVRSIAASVGSYPTSQSQAEIILLSTVQPEAIGWLWQGRMPLGKVTLLDGDPGLGKSCVSLDIAARISSGLPMPDGTPSQSGGVVVMTTEDDIADTVVPRLSVAGANLERIVHLRSVIKNGTSRSPLLTDIEELQEAVRKVSAKLVIVDPLMGFLPAKVDSHRDQDIRQALTPLTKIAAELHIAVIIIRHINKTGGRPAIYRGGGSIGIIGAARSGLLIAIDPDDENRRILAPIKCNLCQPPVPLVFHLKGVDGIPNIAWDGTSTYSADALLAEAEKAPGERTALGEAKEFLRGMLASGPVPEKEIQKQAGDAGISETTLKRAKHAMDVKSEKAEYAGGWYWYFSEEGQATPKGLMKKDDPLREEMTPFDVGSQKYEEGEI